MDTDSCLRSGPGSPQLVAAPFSADKLLVVDVATGKVCGVSTENVTSGIWKWFGMTAVGGKAFVAPYDSHKLLIVDVVTEDVYGVSVEAVAFGVGKSIGITAALGMLVAAPFQQGKLLVDSADPQAFLEADGEGNIPRQDLPDSTSRLSASPGAASSSFFLFTKGRVWRRFLKASSSAPSFQSWRPTYRRSPVMICTDIMTLSPTTPQDPQA